MPDKHALLGPSGAHRFLVCTPSARLEEQFENKSTIYTEEGTRAHSLCEWKLRTLLLNEDIGEMPEPDDSDMDEYTTQYKDFVEEELTAARAADPAAKLLVEQQLDLSEYIPESFGTSDAVIASDKTLTIIDFKYGKGVAVEALDNPQLRLYALGSYLALESIYSFQEVRMIIFQPRICNISEDKLTTEQLLDWAKNYAKPRAELAYIGEGEFVPGEHCRFCKASAICKARFESIFPTFDHEKVLAPILTDDEIPPLMERFNEVRDWMDAVEAYAQDKALNGHHWKGYKLVEGRTMRKITDQIGAMQRLEKAGFTKDEFTTVKLKGIGELEKLVGKKNFPTVLGDLVIKPVGNPTLVKDSDKRQEINPVELVFKEDK